MSKQILNTGWKHWDIYLSKYVNMKINCLEIGSYKGDATVWMLVNLCKNIESKVFSVDSWEGSPEYVNVDFSEIEKKFDENIKNTGKKSQNVKMKMFSTDALIILKDKKYMFDVIFIDASHEAKDVIKDAVLSWDLLNEGGTLIFDDYEWDKLNKDYFRPKIAIDSFIHIFKPELKVVFMGYQAMIEKINHKNIEKPELEDYWKLIEDINNLSNEEIEYNINEDNIKNYIKFDLKTSNKPLQFTKDLKYNEKYYDILENINIIKNNYKNIQYDFNNLIRNPDYSKIFTSLSYDIKEEITKYKINPFIAIKVYNKKYDIDNQNSIYQTINIIKQKNIFNTFGDSIVFLSSTMKCENLKKINNYIKEIFKISKTTSYVFCKDIENEMCENCIINNMGIENLTTLKEKLLLVKNKVDIIFVDYYNVYEKFYRLNLLYSVIISLSVQNKNGCTIINISEINTSIIDYLFILKKYYKNVMIKTNDNNYYLNCGFQIIANGFMNIDNNDLLELYLIYDKCYNNNNFITNIIDNNNEEYLLFKDKFIIFLNDSYAITMKKYNIFIKILNYINNNNISNNKKHMLKNSIYKKQISFLYGWLKNIDLL
jgi:predicted O-methyltransferase YrrM